MPQYSFRGDVFQSMFHITEPLPVFIYVNISQRKLYAVCVRSVHELVFNEDSLPSSEKTQLFLKLLPRPTICKSSYKSKRL